MSWVPALNLSPTSCIPFASLLQLFGPDSRLENEKS